MFCLILSIYWTCDYYAEHKGCITRAVCQRLFFQPCYQMLALKDRDSVLKVFQMVQQELVQNRQHLKPRKAYQPW
jgi:hypothetical protein